MPKAAAGRLMPRAGDPAARGEIIRRMQLLHAEAPKHGVQIAIARADGGAR